MDPAWLLLLLPAAVFSGWLGGRRRVSKRPSQGRPEATAEAYVQSLNLVINDQHDKALDVLSSALEEHDESLEIQLALGSLFRRRGEIERATQIHQRLIARPGLASEQKAQVLFELANDYFKAGLLDRAENLFLEAGNSGALQEPSLRLLIQIYESEREWINAVRAAERLAELSGTNLDPLIAHYRCEIAERSFTKGDYVEAESAVALALKRQANFARAVILQGRLKAVRDEHGRAIKIWTQLSMEHPELAYEVVQLVRSSAERLDAPELLERFLEAALAAGGDERLRLLLINHLSQVGRNDDAEQTLLEWIEQSSSLQGLHRLLQLRQENGSGDLVLSDYALVGKVTHKLIADRPGYECRFCGFQGRSLHWQCPGCKHWDTTSPRSANGLI